MKKPKNRLRKKNTSKGNSLFSKSLVSNTLFREDHAPTNKSDPAGIELQAGACELFPSAAALLDSSTLKVAESRPLSDIRPQDGETGEYPFKPGVYDIFRFPVIDWDFRWQRPQQISRQFAVHGKRVFYITTDMTAVSKETLTKDEVARYVRIKKAAPGVWLVTLCTNRRLNLYQDEMSSQDLTFLRWSIEHVKSKFNVSQMISIVDLPFWTPLVESLEQNKIIYDCMDDHSGFSTNSPSMLLQEDRLIRSSDLVLASSQLLFDKLSALHPSVFLLRNAADVHHFNATGVAPASELEALKGPVIGYYGAISDWFDIHLIHELALKRPEWNFVLIGHTFGCDTSVVEGMDNVMLLGEQPYHRLPSFLCRFDAALIPFKENALTKATNPVKLYEYLAAGKPVISSDLPELSAVAPHLVTMVSGPGAFEQAIGKALELKDPEQPTQKRQFAQLHSWEHRFEELQTAIQLHLFPKVSIVLVTYNNWPYTQQCLRSLLRPGHYPNLEIVIVDNASTDQTRNRLESIRDERIKVVVSENNQGFAAGNSLGCQHATGEYFILLNNDTIVPDSSWVSRLLRPLMEYPDVGMSGPMSNFVGNDQALDHFVGDPVTGAHPNWLQDYYLFHKGVSRETDLLGFFCVAMKKEVWEAVGPLDTGYGIGMFEDDDYCERVKAAGYRLMIAEDAFVYHHGSATIKKLEPDVYKSLWEKNKAYFERKWEKPWRDPKRPENWFHGAETPEEVASRLKKSNQRSILVLGGKNWTANASHWQSIVRELGSRQSRMLIINALRHYNQPIMGIRKAGPQIYLTNVVDLFSQAYFDVVIYCGEQLAYPIHAGRQIAISASYTQDQLAALGNALPSLEYWSGTDQVSLIDMIMDPAPILS
ncbi:GT2 family glycosyltransferase [Fontibacillus phaseoli]|uniref:GT2 family glycosyltransferase n=1 Tax=Fontibacillus phaseoli TaxID=1416533 RepID=A0A369B614_9BACL|nr:glycosyltransferase [Fontibacillus phaseoli]RCX16950.1 GT2 family glycosyltransferase [Fontibacillus phaseoli]